MIPVPLQRDLQRHPRYPPSMMDYFIVGLGGAIGSILRVWANNVLEVQFRHFFPLGTLFVNVTGSFLIGFFAAATASDGRLYSLLGHFVFGRPRDFLMAGLCGGYTTFSAFSLETLRLAQNQHWFYAGANAVLSFALCLAAVWLGHTLGRHPNATGTVVF